MSSTQKCSKCEGRGSITVHEAKDGRDPIKGVCDGCRGTGVHEPQQKFNPYNFVLPPRLYPHELKEESQRREYAAALLEELPNVADIPDVQDAMLTFLQVFDTLGMQSVTVDYNKNDRAVTIKATEHMNMCGAVSVETIKKQVACDHGWNGRKYKSVYVQSPADFRVFYQCKKCGKRFDKEPTREWVDDDRQSTGVQDGNQERTTGSDQASDKEQSGVDETTGRVQ